MGKVLTVLCALCLLLVVLRAEAIAEHYRYIDENGTIHATDAFYKVPAKYQDQVKVTKEETRTDGMTPGLGHALTAREFSMDTWYDYGSMPFYERWCLLALAGTKDLWAVLRTMKIWLFLGGCLLLVGFLYTFQVIDRRATKVLILFTITAMVGTAMFYKYVKAVELNSKTLLHKVSNLQNINRERQVKMMAILNSVDREP